MSSKFLAVILAGGSGTRFWPMSRKARPKQLLSLIGDEPIITSTVKRLDGLIAPQDVWVVCGEPLVEPTSDVLNPIGVDKYVVEPYARNTAPAIMLSAVTLARANPDATLVFLPSDHHVADPSAFRACLERASEVAKDGYIVTLGIEPTRPETGYGYIKRSAEALKHGARVDRFVEKPDETTAQAYLDEGGYFWNAGIFVTTADTLLQEFARQYPDQAAAVNAVLTVPDKELEVAIHTAFEAVPATSIDYAIMENAQKVAVVPASCGWSDVGHWAALHDVMEVDADNNVTKGQVVATRTRDCVLFNLCSDRILAAADVEGMVVVQCDDATLVLPLDKAQSVRDVVDALKSTNLNVFL